MDPKTCAHPLISVEYIAERDVLATRYADSNYYWMACPDCGWHGYPRVNEDGDIEFREEPKGAGASEAW